MCSTLKAEWHIIWTGGDAHEYTILRSPTADGDTPCTCGRAACIPMSADAVLFDCVRRCAGCGGISAAQMMPVGKGDACGCQDDLHTNAPHAARAG